MPRVEQLHETLVLIALSTTMLTLWVEVRCHARNQFRGTTNALQILHRARHSPSRLNLLSSSGSSPW